MYGKILNYFKYLLQKWNLLEGVAAFNVEEQLWLGPEGADELDLNWVGVDTELNDESFDGCDICRLAFVPSRIHRHLETAHHELFLIPKNYRTLNSCLKIKNAWLNSKNAGLYLSFKRPSFSSLWMTVTSASVARISVKVWVTPSLWLACMFMLDSRWGSSWDSPNL